MQKRTVVIRQADMEQDRAVFGSVEAVLPDGRINVRWYTDRRGWKRLNGQAHCQKHDLGSLVEVTPQMREQIVTAHNKRVSAINVEGKRKRLAECPWVCVNVNPDARNISKAGHPQTLCFQSIEGKDGACPYCGAPLINRCKDELCELGTMSGSKYCEEHSKQEEELDPFRAKLQAQYDTAVAQTSTTSELRQCEGCNKKRQCRHRPTGLISSPLIWWCRQCWAHTTEMA